MERTKTPKQIWEQWNRIKLHAKTREQRMNWVGIYWRYRELMNKFAGGYCEWYNPVPVSVYAKQTEV